MAHAAGPRSRNARQLTSSTIREPGQLILLEPATIPTVDINLEHRRLYMSDNQERKAAREGREFKVRPELRLEYRELLLEEMVQQECCRCGYRWQSRLPNGPPKCARCGTKAWAMPSKNGARAISGDQILTKSIYHA